MNACTTTELDHEHERSVCQRYSNRIRAYGLCHLRDAASAEDLVQQVLLTVLQALRGGRVNEVDNLDKYVFGTCRNTVMEMRRDPERLPPAAHRRAPPRPGPASPRATSRQWDHRRSHALDRCLAGLEARARAVILATFVDEREADEIGRAMGLSAGNVRLIRHRTLAHLQRCMEGRREA